MTIYAMVSKRHSLSTSRIKTIEHGLLDLESIHQRDDVTPARPRPWTRWRQHH